MVAIFHVPGLKLTEGEFNDVINNTEIETFEPPTLGGMLLRRTGLIGNYIGYRNGGFADEVAQTAFKMGADKITLPPLVTGTDTTVIKTKSPLRPCDGNKVDDYDALAEAAHELVHAVQISRTSGKEFLAKYASYYDKLKFGFGYSHDDAYRCNPYEVQAYAFDEAIRTIFDDRRNKAKFKEACGSCEGEGLYKLTTNNAAAKDLANQFIKEFRNGIKAHIKDCYSKKSEKMEQGKFSPSAVRVIRKAYEDLESQLP